LSLPPPELTPFGRKFKLDRYTLETTATISDEKKDHNAALHLLEGVGATSVATHGNPQAGVLFQRSETFDMTFAKDNAAEEGFNRWTINGVAYPMSNEMAPASFHLKQGKRYRLRLHNASDNIHPIHLHRPPSSQL
jgi:FtsP/CotA-like multicopper oxidase with cupredoxin domain